MLMPSMKRLGVEFDIAARNIFVRIRTQPAFSEMAAALDEIFADPRFRPGFSLVFDRTALHLPATTDYIKRKAVYIDQAHLEQGVNRWAFVVGDPGPYGMGRMLEQLTEFQESVRTFKDIDSALFWIAAGVPEGEAWAVHADAIGSSGLTPLRA
jgi:hypothetical protein